MRGMPPAGRPEGCLARVRGESRSPSNVEQSAGGSVEENRHYYLNYLIGTEKDGTRVLPADAPERK
jgi:hypothetical protein